MEGVTVRLGKANKMTTTAPDGTFRLGEITTGVTPGTNRADFLNDIPVSLEHGRLLTTLKKLANVGVRVYDGNGRLLFSYKKSASSGRCLITLPELEPGLHIYQISIAEEQYMFRFVDGVASNRSTLSSRNDPAPEKQAIATVHFDDALIFTKPGYRLHRMALTKPDTSGIQITLALLDTGSVTDIEGNIYKTVRIGNQEWTTENLRTTKYNDNTGITQGASGAAYSYYNNTTDAAAKKKWGALYSYAAVKTGKLAPSGWHVSTDAEWDTLQMYLMANGYNYDGTISVLNRGTSETDDNKIAKSISATTDWTADTLHAGAIGNEVRTNNTCGFSALPGGYRSFDGEFFDQGNFCFFWTATEHDASFAWYRFLWSVTPDVCRGDRVKTLECSVRVVRNR